MSSVLKQYTKPAFLICVAVLILATFGMNATKKKMKVLLEKDPIPPKISFDLVDESKLSPFKVVKRMSVEGKDLIRALGTDDYLKWVIEDAESDSSDPTHTMVLFITYYRKADAVPHVPEECYTGGGYKKDSAKSTSITFNVPADINDPNGTVRKVPGQYLVFEKAAVEFWQKSASFPVAYFFCVNGKLANTRSQARLILASNLTGKHSYFSKVEMVFNASGTAPDMEQTVKACERLLSVLLPVLEQDHWPGEQDLMPKN